MADIPSESGRDHTLALLREGYGFGATRCRRYDSDLFETRLLGRRAICMRGAQAARAFYADDDRFTRRRALPPTALTLLQDKGSVTLLDGAAHRQRKRLFLELMQPGAFERLVELTVAELRAGAQRWQRRAGLVLHRAMQEVLCRAVCSWAGVPLGDTEVAQRTHDLAALIDGSGSLGPRQWSGQYRRRRSERWARRVIERARAGTLAAPPDSAVQAIARHRELDGELLSPTDAAVELINVLRPTVAIARYITFAALALHAYPDARRQVRDGGSAAAERVVQEVRRFYPFVPLVGGRVREPFEWAGARFERGRWVLLDIYATNHDPQSWAAPERFDPERFNGWQSDPFTLIPHGGGDHHSDHRCPGEWITTELTKLAVELLATELSYRVPEQDLRVRLERMPAIPESGFVIEDIRAPA